MLQIIEQLGRRIQLLRKEKGLTQEQLAEAANLSVDAISGIERATFSPSLKTIEKLASALGVYAEVIFKPLPTDEREQEIRKLLRCLENKSAENIELLYRIAKEIFRSIS
jgi:transcriptional regulator with XRE-family HTH domain